MKDLERFIDTQSLALSHAKLMEEIESLPPGTEISVAKEKEIARLERTLKKKLYKALSSDILPVKKSALPANYIATLTRPKKPKPIEKKAKISFHFEVLSSMNTKIDRFKVDAPTKEEAWKEAEEKAKKYPGKIKLKIS